VILSPLALILGLVVGQRLGELIIARRNTRRLLAQGAREVGAGHYPLFLALHTAWLATLALVVDPWKWPNPALIGAYLALQLARLWVISSLGPYWTTRIITLDHAPLVRRGPFRLIRHPNYIIVAAEIAVLPLAFGAWRTALVFSALNAALLAWRIRIEDQALAARRAAP